MLSVVDCGTGGPRSSSCQGRYVVFLGGTLYPLSASLHSGGGENALLVAAVAFLLLFDLDLQV